MQIDFKDLSKYKIVRKDSESAALTDEQLVAIAELSKAQGSITSLDPATQSALSGLRARYHGDPNIVGAAVIADFSIRAVSIHKTWSVFKDRRVGSGDIPKLDPNDVRLDVFYSAFSPSKSK